MFMRPSDCATLSIGGAEIELRHRAFARVHRDDLRIHGEAEFVDAPNGGVRDAHGFCKMVFCFSTFFDKRCFDHFGFMHQFAMRFQTPYV